MVYKDVNCVKEEFKTIEGGKVGTVGISMDGGNKDKKRGRSSLKEK